MVEKPSNLQCCCFGQNFANWRLKKKKTQCDLYKGFFFENFQKIRHISSKKKKKKKEFAWFRQWVRVARLDLGRIQKKTLLSAYDSRHLMRIKAGDPRQRTYLRNLEKKTLLKKHFVFKKKFF